MDAVRHVPDLSVLPGPERRPHLARDLTVQLGDAVRRGRKPKRERRQPEAVHSLGPAEREERVVGEPRACREVAGVPQYELVPEHLIARRDRGVRGEDRRPPHLFERALGLLAGGDELASPLDREERGVALVDVKDGWRDAERLERAHPADTEQELLPDPVLPVAAVERVGEQADLEQIERHGADVVAPDGGVDGLVGQLDVDRDRLAHKARGLGVDRLVVLGLAAHVAQALREVAAAVEEADADERQSEIRCRLEVIAGEHPQAARVDRQLRADGELHAEVGDEEVAVGAAVRVRPPGVVECGVERGQSRAWRLGRTRGSYRKGPVARASGRS